MRYVIKNIKTSLKNNPAVSWLYVLCTVISVLAVLFSHGVYQNYEAKIIKDDMSAVDNAITVGFGDNITNKFTNKNGNTQYDGDGKSTFGQFRQVLEKLDVETREEMYGFCVFCDVENTTGLIDKDSEYYSDRISIFVSMIYDKENNDFGFFERRRQNNPVVIGRNFTSEEYLTGEHYVLAESSIKNSVKDANSLIGRKIELMGQQFTIIGISETGFGYEVPFCTVPDELEFRNVAIIGGDKPITTKAYNRFCSAMHEVYGDKVFLPDIKTLDEEEQTFYRSIMLISLVLSAIAAITLAILFRFIIYTRRKSLAVLRLSGCTRNGARIMYITEGIGITAALFLLTTLAYNKWILPHLTVFFDRITEVYTPKTYLYIAAVFLGTLFVVLNIMVSLNVDRQPVDMLKKAGGK